MLKTAKSGKDIAQWISKHGKTIAAYTAAGIGTMGVLDYVVNQGAHRVDAHKQLSRAKQRQATREKHMHDLAYIPKELYTHRTGHTNSWGGKKY